MIEATYAISKEDFAEAQKLWCPQAVKQLPGQIFYLTLVYLLSALIGASIAHMHNWISVCLAVVLVSFWGFMQWRKKAVIDYQYKTNSEQYQQVQATIDDSGYRDQRPGISEAWLAWPAFTGWRENTRVFILGKNLTFVTIPKQALTDDQQTELRTLLESRINAGK